MNLAIFSIARLNRYYTVRNEEAFTVFQEESETFGSSITTSTSTGTGKKTTGVSNFTLVGVVEETDTKGFLFPLTRVDPLPGMPIGQL